MTSEPGASSPAGPSTSRPGGLRRLSGVWLAVAGMMLLVGLVGGYFIARSQVSHDAAAIVETNARLDQMQAALAQSEERNWSYFRATEALKAELERSSAGRSSTTTPGSAGRDGVYSEGVYVVGEDLPAGTYDGAVDGKFGYWARLKDTDGSIASIIENGLVKGPFVLTVESTDKAVELRGVTLTSR